MPKNKFKIAECFLSFHVPHIPHVPHVPHVPHAASFEISLIFRQMSYVGGIVSKL